jgi:hypothetical protein
MKADFGPNQDEVVALLKRLKAVDQPQALLLASLAKDDAARHAAREAILQTARAGEREAELRRAQDEVTRWVNRWFSGGFQIAGYGRDITPADAAVGAAPVVLDAVGALVLRDLLDGETFDTLIGPWRELDAPAIG